MLWYKLYYLVPESNVFCNIKLNIMAINTCNNLLNLTCLRASDFCFVIIRMSGPKIDVSEFTVLIKNSIEFPTLTKGERK